MTWLSLVLHLERHPALACRTARGPGCRSIPWMCSRVTAGSLTDYARQGKRDCGTRPSNSRDVLGGPPSVARATAGFAVVTHLEFGEDARHVGAHGLLADEQ